MEKFEISKDIKLETFSSFINITKEKISIITDNIRENIKKFEESIENANAELNDAKASREKCENEISKMEGKIDTIKDAIDNVENTYKRIVEAYSSTSKGETKELYSEIIDGAKANCEKEVEKNRNDIARLNSDIEAIKNNIQEFNRLIEGRERDLDTYKQELYKYEGAKGYIEKVSDNIVFELSNINNDKPIKKLAEKGETKKRIDEIILKPQEEYLYKEPEIADKFTYEIPQEPKITENIIYDIPEKAETTDKINHEEFEEPNIVNEELQRIYDLTGYKKDKSFAEPSQKEEKEKTVIEEPNIEAEINKKPEKIYTNDLENLFATPSEDVVLEPAKEEYDDTDMFEWEKLLNSADNIFDVKEPKLEVKRDIKKENSNETVNELLMPYGTTFERLQRLVGNNITYKDGTTKTFDMTSDDVIKAINAVDGNDLKAMKTIGPEITLIRIIKKMKEGK